jgi:hypothetical protein
MWMTRTTRLSAPAELAAIEVAVMARVPRTLARDVRRSMETPPINGAGERRQYYTGSIAKISDFSAKGLSMNRG